MNSDIKNKWIISLTNGDYKQGGRELRKNNVNYVNGIIQYDWKDS